MQGENNSGQVGPHFRITEVRIKLTEDPRNKLRAYASVTIDDAFVVRDLKIIDGSKGPFVAMPSRKLADHCRGCHHKNHLRAAYCNQCGAKLDPDRAPRDARGRSAGGRSRARQDRPSSTWHGAAGAGSSSGGPVSESVALS